MPRKSVKKPTYIDPRPLVERSLAKDEKTGRSARSVTVNLAESPLCWLHSRGHLTDRQLLAGEKLREVYEAASIGPCVTMRWENLSMGRVKRAASGGVEASAKILSACDHFNAALAALGSDLSDVAWRVICANEGVAVAEKTMGWPARSGKLVLRIALDRLADYYRIAA